MRYLATVFVLVAAFGPTSGGAGEAPADKPTPEQIRAWRAEGPAAVDRLMLERQQRIAAAEKLQPEGISASSDLSVWEETPALRAAWERVYAINETIDTVAAARYSHESGLYWYTDEVEARRVAKEQGKPLLALRLLGNLNQELSCANSRYFRILLYPDDKVRKLLHDKFVLTWKSVRPVPKITIDLGDGRKVERTITGNSVHYVLAPDGQIVDVFPGLYGPVPFYERLAKAHDAVVKAIQTREPAASITEYRKLRIAELKRAWETDVARYKELLRQPRKEDEQGETVGWAPAPQPSFWEAAAGFHPEYSVLSKVSLDLIKHEAMLGYYGRIHAGSKPIATRHGERIIPVFAFSKGGDERVFRDLLECVQPAMRADTVHNEYAGRYRVLELLEEKELFDRDHPDSDIPERDLLEELNRHLYSHIFGYNPDDPWIGLSDLDSLTALPKDRGLSREAGRRE